jgi:tetratricopeptide (TPR) repeat protein
MPPKTAWEWLEAFGAVTADPEKVHGDWTNCRAEVGERLESLIPAAKLEEMLTATKPMALSPAKKQICYGSAWGKLENLRREKSGEIPVCPHLDFGELTEAETPWATLLESGQLPTLGATEAPVSWMLQKEWTAMLENAAPTHEHDLHLAAIYLAQRRVRDAEEAVNAALSYGELPTPTALFLKAQIFRLKGDLNRAAETALSALLLNPADVSLARQALALALSAGKHEEIAIAYKLAPQTVKTDGRVAMTYAFALLRMGQVAEAEEVLLRDGGLSVTDIREGEISLTSL